MRVFLVAAILALATSNALAAACKVEAGNKKLAGAALTSFMTKCERDAKEMCNRSADDKKLHGAARNSYVNKCVTDAVGAS